MKKLVDRIEQLEKGNAVWAGCRLIRLEEGGDADAAVEKDRNETGFTGDYVLLRFIAGRWEDRDDGTWWVRPDGSVDVSQGRLGATPSV